MTFNLTIVAILVLIGIILLLIELFLLPGFGIAGITGIALLVGGIFYAYMYVGATAGTITLVTTIVLLGGAFVGLIKSKALQRIALTTDINETVDNSELKEIHKGDTGVAISRLNPIGRVMINDVMVEGKSFDGELIDEESEIEVVSVSSFNVVVRKKGPAASGSGPATASI